MAIPIVRTDFEFSSIYNALKNSFSNKEICLEEQEEKFYRYSNKNFNIFFPKLRFGMEASFRSAFKNELIGVPTYTCSVVPHSVVLSGNKIKFYDSNKNNLSTEVFGDNLKSYIVTPWYGSPLDENISHSSKSFGDFSHINILDRKYINNNFLATFYSFSSGKPISSIGGGLVSTNNKELYLKIKSIRNEEFGKDFTKSLYFTNFLFSICGYLFNSLNLETAKIYLDDNYYLDFLRESLDEISLGSKQKKIDKYTLAMLDERLLKYQDIKKNVMEFWNHVLVKHNLYLLNNDNWSNSHLILKTNERNVLKKNFTELGIQSSFGANYLNHKIIPYNSYKDTFFPNAINHYENILQLPVNLSEDNFNKLKSKKTKIEKILQRIFD